MYLFKYARYLLKIAAPIDYLQDLNIRLLSKEIPKESDESPRDYFSRLIDIGGPLYSKDTLEIVATLDEKLMPKSYKPFIRLLANDLEKNPQALSEFLKRAGSLKSFIDDSGWKDSYKTLSDIFTDMDNPDSHGNVTIKSKPKAVYNFRDGFYIARLDVEHLPQESQIMQNCTGNDNVCESVRKREVKLYALKDPSGNSHVHIEISPNNELLQLKGKQNTLPSEKYRPYLKEWLKGMRIDAEFHKDYLNLFEEDELMQMFHESGNDFAYAHAARWSGDAKLKAQFIEDALNNYEKGFENFSFINIGTIGDNPHLTPKEQKILFDNANVAVLINLAKNPYLDMTIVDEIIANFLLPPDSRSLKVQLVRALTDNSKAVEKYEELLIKLSSQFAIKDAFFNLIYTNKLSSEGTKQIIEYAIKTPGEHHLLTILADICPYADILEYLYNHFLSAKDSFAGLSELADNRHLNHTLVTKLYMLNNQDIDNSLIDNPSVNVHVKQMLKERQKN